MNVTNAPAKSNRHIVDQLADVRAEIKELETREAELKAEVSKRMGGADSLGGSEFIASQRLTTRKGSLDEVRLREAGVDVDKYRKPTSTVLSIVVERRAEAA